MGKKTPSSPQRPAPVARMSHRQGTLRAAQREEEEISRENIERSEAGGAAGPEGIQGARRMPWRREPTKGAASRDSPGGAAHGLRSRGARMGEPSRRGPATHPVWEATGGTETSKYPEERKSRRDPPSSGERTGASPNRGARTSVRALPPRG